MNTNTASLTPLVAYCCDALYSLFACTDFCSKLKLNVIELQDIEIFEPLSDTFLINLKIFLILVGYIHLLKHGFLGALRPVHSSNH